LQFGRRSTLDLEKNKAMKKSLDQVKTDWLALRGWIAIPNSLISSRFSITLSLASPRSSLFSR
jgi:hypothetical protein